jgi:hypothetical protein
LPGGVILHLPAAALRRPRLSPLRLGPRLLVPGPQLGALLLRLGLLLGPLQPETLEHVSDRLVPINRLLGTAFLRGGAFLRGAADCCFFFLAPREMTQIMMTIIRISKKPSIA